MMRTENMLPGCAIKSLEKGGSFVNNSSVFWFFFLGQEMFFLFFLSKAIIEL